MTEAEWLAATDPTPMLRFLRGRACDRKLRLFACARCRELWPMLTDERSRTAVEVGELFADGLATSEALNAAYDLAMRAGGAAKQGREAICRAALSVASECEPDGESCWETVWDQCPDDAERSALRMAESKEITFLRDLFGPLPFRQVAFDPTWLTSTVVALARQMYEGRDFSPMPVLADALQDAGCNDDEVLAHCRGDGPHVRGCWVTDLLLDKERGATHQP